MYLPLKLNFFSKEFGLIVINYNKVYQELNGVQHENSFQHKEIQKPLVGVKCANNLVDPLISNFSGQCVVIAQINDL